MFSDGIGGRLKSWNDKPSIKQPRAYRTHPTHWF